MSVRKAAPRAIWGFSMSFRSPLLNGVRAVRVRHAVTASVALVLFACDLGSLEKTDSGASSGSDGGSDGSVSDAANTNPAVWPKVATSCSSALDCEGTSCCESLLVPGGTFMMGRSIDGTDACPPSITCNANELPEHTATVGDFYLDTFEVTVGRFRKFVANYQKPKVGDGAHPKIQRTGWRTAWNDSLPLTAAQLSPIVGCLKGDRTWTAEPGVNENLPITCVDWATLFAFCAWDGGRLPTEAEWEYAAAGGSENRLYPWGAHEPTSTLALTNFDKDVNLMSSVGSRPLGRGRWLQQDLDGSVEEWVLDGWANYSGEACDNCAAPVDDSNYAVARRGGYYYSVALRSAWRGSDWDIRNTSAIGMGGRCARDR